MPSAVRPLDLVPLMLCPVCGEQLEAAGRVPAQGLRCAAGHQYDGARQGYVNMLTGRGTRFIPDTAEMVAARDAFLGAGHYAPLARQLAATAGTLLAGTQAPVLLDAGSGTGYYLEAVLRSVMDGRAFALDLSKFALRRAARALPDALCVVWDLWKPFPLAAGSTDLILNVFAPRNPAEFARVLKPGGHLVVATAAPGHLGELRDVVPLLAVDADKAERLGSTLGDGFEEVDAVQLQVPLELDAEDMVQLVMMGPNAHHSDAGKIRAAAAEATAAGGFEVTARFTVSTYRRLGRG
ncbi:putative RNA methyltransferase [Arthrobacter sulfonylureivorans]|uniref:putative RNA methyltransferase n=1 Tax=Arthrobacter sulfonylureivorans TaxID=2486855 RepID=UPI0039E5DAF4